MRNFGYFAPSRIYNIDYFRYKQRETLYINLERNMYQGDDYKGMLKALVSGKQILTTNRVDSLFEAEMKKRV